MTEPARSALVADIGGTNARFGLVESGSVRARAIRQFSCNDFPSLPDAIDTYLASVIKDGVHPVQAVIAVATPVSGDLVKLTNNHWEFSIQQLQRQFELSDLQFVNDFTVQALAIPHLRQTDFTQVGSGQKQSEHPLAVIGPGTGLGVSGLVMHSGDQHIALEGEGGHVTIAARSEREYQVISHLRRRLNHVSAERILSGPGLSLLHDALREIDGLEATSREPSEITRAALAGSDSHCEETLGIFCSQLGSVAADLALVLGAKGGVFICGGIVPKLGRYFAQSGFRDAFEDKGRLSNYLRTIPTYVVTAENPALVGAASLTFSN